MIEIIIIFCLVVTCISILSPVKSADGANVIISKHIAFGVFLFMSFVWNGLMVHVMQGLSWMQLVVSGLNGSVFELEGVKEYISHFNETIKKAEKEIQKQGSTEDAFKNMYQLFTSIFRASAGRTITQLLAHHITWVALIIGTFLLCGYDKLITSESYLGWRYWFLIAIIVVSPFLFVPYYIVERWHDGQKVLLEKLLKGVAGLSFTILLIAFYATFDADSIILVMAFQQMVVSAFLLYATFDKSQSVST